MALCILGVFHITRLYNSENGLTSHLPTSQGLTFVETGYYHVAWASPELVIPLTSVSQILGLCVPTMFCLKTYSSILKGCLKNAQELLSWALRV